MDNLTHIVKDEFKNKPIFNFETLVYPALQNTLIDADILQGQSPTLSE